MALLARKPDAFDAGQPDVPHVEQQAKHPMDIGAAQVGLGDQFGKNAGIARRPFRRPAK
jgi:hypothetical protein